MSDCTAKCWATPDCTVCGLRKPPRGRSVAYEAAGGYCGWDCEGYDKDPKAGHYWPNEHAEKCSYWKEEPCDCLLGSMRTIGSKEE